MVQVWTETTGLTQEEEVHGSVGTTTAGLKIGGETPRTANTESWNGSSWTEVTDEIMQHAQIQLCGEHQQGKLAGGYDYQ